MVRSYSRSFLSFNFRDISTFVQQGFLQVKLLFSISTIQDMNFCVVLLLIGFAIADANRLRNKSGKINDLPSLS
jgi:hypothetical protein